MAYYIVLSIGVIVSFIFCLKRSKGFSLSNLLYKAVSSLFYLLTAVFALINRIKTGDAQAFGSLIIMGGAFGLVGDIMLDLKGVYKQDERVYLHSGFIAFLIGHIFYISAVVYSMRMKWWLVLIGALVAIGGGVLTVASANVMKVHYGAYRKIVAVYTSFLLMTAVVSFIAMLVSHFDKGYILMFVGAVLFALSDVILSGTFFGRGKDKKRHYFINHFLYYAAQYMIAASIMFIN